MDHKITFQHAEFSGRNPQYPDYFIVSNYHNTKGILDIKKEIDKIEKHCNKYDWAIEELQRRTTNEYFQRVYAAQTNAQSYSIKVFPAYKFILPETLADDWNSTMDWHKEWQTRDHSLHQPLTAYIVQKLLGFGDAGKSLQTPNGRLLDLCADKLIHSPQAFYVCEFFSTIYPEFNNWDKGQKLVWAKSFFYETAVVAALLHDIGYPWQFVNRLQSHIDFGNYIERVSSLEEGSNIGTFLSNHLLLYPFYKYQRFKSNQALNSDKVNVEEFMQKAYLKTHGFPGALAFLRLCERTFKFPNQFDCNAATTKLKIEWAAVAIMMHDMEGLYSKGNNFLRLSFDVDPLSCIIAMADVLEEFERPSACFDGEDDNHKGYVRISYDAPCVGTNIEIEGSVMKIIYIYKNFDIAKKNEGRRVREIKNYFAKGSGFIDLSALGIDEVVCKTAEYKV